MREDFTVDYRALIEQINKINNILSLCDEQLIVLSKRINHIISAEEFRGNTANNTKLYLHDIHINGFITTINDIIYKIKNLTCEYVSGYFDYVDSSRYTYVQKQYLENVISDINRKMTEIEQIVIDINSKINVIGDIFESERLSSDNILNNLDATKNVIRNYEFNIENYDAKSADDIRELRSVIQQTTNSVKYYLEKDNSYIKEYVGREGQKINTSYIGNVNECIRINGIMAEKDNTINKSMACDPINIATGGYILNETDLELEDINGHIKVERRYNSTEENVSWLGGKRWLFNFETVLEHINGQMIVLLPDGHVEKFDFEDGIFNNIRGGNRKYTLEQNGKDGYILLERKTGKRYYYDYYGNIQCISDKNNNIIRYEYIGELPVRIRCSNGQYIDITYNKERQVESITDFSGRKVIYEYNEGLMSGILFPDNTKTVYGYLESGLIAYIESENGKRYIDNEYDNKGRVIKQRLISGEIYINTYDDEKKENTTYETSIDTITRYSYNNYYEITKVRYYDNTTVDIEYDIWGNKSLVSNRKCDETKTTYDIFGNVLEAIFPNGLIVSREYNSDGLLIHISDNAGREEFCSYDERANLILSRKKINEDKWRLCEREYDGFGRVISIKDSYGMVERYIYNTRFSKPSKVIKRAGQVQCYEYDLIGRMIKEYIDDWSIEYEYDNIDRLIRVIDGEGNITRRFYTASGNISKEIAPNEYIIAEDNGKGTIYQYDDMQDIVKRIKPSGSVHCYKRNARREVIKEVNPNYYNDLNNDGDGLIYEYDKDGNKIKTLRPDNTIKREFFDVLGNLLKSVNIDEYNQKKDNGIGYEYRYDSMNNIQFVIAPNGIVEKKTIYDKAGYIVKEINAKGYAMGQEDRSRPGTMYNFDLLGKIISKREYIKEEKRGYRLTEYEYDLEGRLTKEIYYLEYQTATTREGKVREVISEYDNDGRLIKVSYPDGGITEYRYNNCNQVITMKKRISASVYMCESYYYDKAGRLIEKKLPADARCIGKSVVSTRYAYDKNGNNIRVISPKGNEIRKYYDIDNRLISEEHIEKNGDIFDKITYEYDFSDNVISKTDCYGNKKIYKYDAMNRLIEEIDENGDIIFREYNGYDKVIKEIINYNSKNENKIAIWKYTYDEFARNTMRINPEGNVIYIKKYNLYGELIEELDTDSSGIKNTYDFGGRKIKARTKQGIVQSYEYDAQSNKISVQTGEKRKITYTYDDMGRAIQVNMPTGYSEYYEYDNMGNITSAIDGNGKKTRYIYNELNKLSEVIFDDGSVKYYGYDGECRLAAIKNPDGSVVRYQRNFYGDIAKKRNLDTGLTSYNTFYPDGKIKTAVMNNVIYEYEYDCKRRIISKKKNGQIIFENKYDIWDNKTDIRFFEDNNTRYTYDFAGKVIEIRDDKQILARYSYFNDGRVRHILAKNETEINYKYDLDKNIKNISMFIGEEKVFDEEYLYDDAGNCVEIISLNGKKKFEYDVENRLIMASNHSHCEKYIYDNAGNRIKKIINNGECIEEYSYNVQNRLTNKTEINKLDGKYKSTEYLYDINGNMLTKIEEITKNDDKKRLCTKYLYNGFNQLERITDDFGNEYVYGYDAEGMRCSIDEKYNNKHNKSTEYVYDNMRLMVQLNKDSNIRYIHGKGIMYCSFDNVGDYCTYILDENNSTRLSIINEQVRNYDYDVFGNPTNLEENDDTRVLYNGEQFDNFSKLYYMKSRYYSADNGRFIQKDSYYGDGLNLYSYACDIIGLNQKKPFKQKEFWLV